MSIWGPHCVLHITRTLGTLRTCRWCATWSAPSCGQDVFHGASAKDGRSFFVNELGVLCVCVCESPSPQGFWKKTNFSRPDQSEGMKYENYSLKCDTFVLFAEVKRVGQNQVPFIVSMVFVAKNLYFDRTNLRTPFYERLRSGNGKRCVFLVLLWGMVVTRSHYNILM